MTKVQVYTACGIFAVGACLGWWLHKAPVREVIKWQTKIETRYVTTERIVTKPGATVYVDPSGGMIITGGVEITRSTSGQSTQTASGQTTITPVERSWLVGGGVGLGTDGVVSYGGMLGRRVGPFWAVVQVYGVPVRGYAGVAVMF